MKLLKTRKRKVWHSVCDGLYSYRSTDTHYIVELNEQEYLKVQTFLNKNKRK